ncbi:amino acid ABC transporter ATP-binding protein [Helicobacter sp. MIT 05-5293]|uniref:Arginine ABC transporter ATP-binding protein n=1 Tax=uncultured Helicobacter sp. TaxID=175537 RepID=A0A650ELV4_9HELI|nr:amino acid ABC transporter ATP-binding protein [Helicobacter sp. MIT 05-5293]QGT50422.1 arginine ABC transporter ATP-binding protein [uncultured Helicobacter sp.]TLD82156.1 amino acid ABC transporter ATP-binding protein [Helicobacter sp. MIT 05-5293]
MVELKNVNKTFAQHHILKNIHLHIKEGEIIAIIGPSGAGKSTLLRCINLLERPQSGSIRIDNVSLDYASFSQKAMLDLRRKSTMVFQHYNLFVNKNVLQNITEALIVVKKIPKKQAEEIAFNVLEKVGLRDKASSYPYQLSGGQQQRVGIARALAIDSTLILFDEPTSALDPELVGEVLETIKKIHNKTMIIVTHELSFARSIAQRIVFMTQGEILEENPPEIFFTQPIHQRTKDFLQSLHAY